MLQRCSISVGSRWSGGRAGRDDVGRAIFQIVDIDPCLKDGTVGPDVRSPQVEDIEEIDRLLVMGKVWNGRGWLGSPQRLDLGNNASRAGPDYLRKIFASRCVSRPCWVYALVTRSVNFHRILPLRKRLPVAQSRSSKMNSEPSAPPACRLRLLPVPRPAITRWRPYSTALPAGERFARQPSLDTRLRFRPGLSSPDCRLTWGPQGLAVVAVHGMVLERSWGSGRGRQPRTSSTPQGIGWRALATRRLTQPGLTGAQLECVVAGRQPLRPNPSPAHLRRAAAPGTDECPTCAREIHTPPSTWTLLLWRFARPYKDQLLAGFILTLLSTGATLVRPTSPCR